MPRQIQELPNAPRAQIRGPKTDEFRANIALHDACHFFVHGLGQFPFTLVWMRVTEKCPHLGARCHMER
jgi:hypothetical protein